MSGGATLTLEGKSVVKEGWLTLYKGKKTGLFSSKLAPDKEQGRGWAVLYQATSKPYLCYYQDNRKETKVMKKEKLELHTIREIAKVIDHPKHPFSISMKCKGNKRILLHFDKEADVNAWLKVISGQTSVEFKREKVIWEYYDGGLWNALPDGDSFRIEAHYSESDNTFFLGDAQVAFQYNLNNMTRLHPRTKTTHRLKRTVFIEDRPEVTHSKMMDLPAFWEWGNVEKDLWHPFERETNIQIEDMYDSGSQWAELTLCLPSPMPFLLDLHDMKLVNFRTAARYGLRRIDNSANMVQGSSCPRPRSPSPDDFDDEAAPQPSLMSPMSPLFKSIQDCLQHLQVSRKNLTHKQMLGEGAFGDVYLADAKDLPGEEGKILEVAVKQLRLSDFIARHGHHSQQMEDFLREAKEMSKIDHPRVVKLIAVCTLDYPLLLIEEYMNQGDLLGVLKDSRPSMALLTQLDIAYQVADAMDYLANGLNCVHRDLAARNILVSQDYNKKLLAKVADFGLSRHLYSEMYKHQGSKPRPLPAKWMALESLMYFIFTTKSDVWSYGVLIWEIMTLGRSPYPGVENRELLEQIEEKGLKLSKPKPCPSHVYEMILDCTQHEPDERPTFSQLRQKMEDLTSKVREGTICCDERDSLISSPGTSTQQSPTRLSQAVPATPDNSYTYNKESVAASPGEVTGVIPNTSVQLISSQDRLPDEHPELNQTRSTSVNLIVANTASVASGDNKLRSDEESGMSQTKNHSKDQLLGNENFNSQDEDMQEYAGGHLYYLLDRVDEDLPQVQEPQLPPVNSLPPTSPCRSNCELSGSCS